MKKSVGAVLLILAMMAAMLPTAVAVGQDKLPDEDDFGYVYQFVTADTIEITEYNGYESEVAVPSEIDGYTVVGIASFTADGETNERLTKVTLPDTVTYIADSAFEYSVGSYGSATALREVVPGKGLQRIGRRAFARNLELQKITIPAGVTEIGEEAFVGCQNLSKITFEGEASFCGSAFGTQMGFCPMPGAVSAAYQDWLYDDTAGDFFVWQDCLFGYRGADKTPKIPDGVRVIAAYSFYQSEITGVEIPDSVRAIGDHAFQACPLVSVDIPGSVEKIENGAFCDCEKLETVTFHPGLKVIDEYAFEDCTALEKVELPDGLLELNDVAFGSCYALKDIRFPASLEKTDRSAIQDTKYFENLASGQEIYCGGVFLGYAGMYIDPPQDIRVKAGTKNVLLTDYLDNVRSITLPEGLLYATFTGYYDCKITSLSFPESVEYINCSEFPELVSLKLPTSATLERGAFYNCPKLKSVKLPKGNAYLSAFSNCDQLETLTLPDDVVTLGPIGGKSLKQIDLGKTLRVIGEDAFSGDSALTDITIPDSVVTLEFDAFKGCTSLSRVRGGKNVTLIEGSCFNGCTSLTDFGALTESVRQVGHRSFVDTGWYMRQKSGVVYFGNIAYCYKGSMPQNTVLSFREGTEAITDGFIFAQEELTPRTMHYFQQDNLIGVILPNTVIRVGGYAFCNSPNVETIVLGGAREVGASAFNAHKSSTIVLPDSMRFVGDNAFSSEYLKAVSLNEGLRMIDEGGFFSAGLIKSVTVPESVIYIGREALGYQNTDDFYDAVIDGFIVYGKKGSTAQQYAEKNGLTFQDNAPTETEPPLTAVVPATCQSEGYTLSVSRRSGKTVRTDIVPKTGHKAVTDDTVQAGCVNPGYTGGSHCAYCGVTISGPIQSAPLGHQWNDGQFMSEPGWEGYGLVRYVCQRCGAVRYEISGQTHQHNYTTKTVTYPTCTAGGYTVYTCECGYSYQTDYVKALGHNFVNNVCTRCHLSRSEASCDGGANCPSRNFTDVGKKKWYHQSVDYVVLKKLMDGTGNGRFEPDSNMTRAMFVTVLGRMSGVKVSHKVRTAFSDVKQGQWYTGYVKWASDNGIVNGVSKTRFAPDENVTREQICKMVAEYSSVSGITLKTINREVTFRDNDKISGWAKKYVKKCQTAGIVGGDNGYFYPLNNATRAEVATILMRYIQNYGKS